MSKDSEMPRIQSFKKIKGFTLVELMVVISVIAILAIIGLTVYSGVQAKARQAKLSGDFNSIYKNIEVKRFDTGLVLMGITGSNCSDCANSCRTGNNIYSYAPCYNGLISQWAKVTVAPLPQDPWGSYYSFDENEKENGTCSANKDVFKSAGPDRSLGTGDDITYNVPFFECPQ